MATEAFVGPDPYRLPIPPVESPFFDELLAGSGATAEEKALARHYHEHGYVIVDVGLPDFASRCERMIADLAPHYPDTLQGRRIDEAWYHNDDVRALACAPTVLAVLALLYQRQPFPFQTLNFDLGTEQPAHSDTIHFHCVPRRFMAGAWVPLEDVDPDCGTLFVVPGSHRLPDYDMAGLGLPARSDAYRGYEELVARLLQVHGLQRHELTLRRGQAVIWAANLFHGGGPRRDPTRTRHSQATHYYFEDCLYYMPLETDLFGGRLCLREVVDIARGRMVPHRYGERTVDLEGHPHVFRYRRPLPAWVEVVRADNGDSKRD